ncbi:MAG: glucoamylase family protein [Lachnospirales bacterium]
MRFINYILSILFIIMLVLTYVISGEIDYFMADNNENLQTYIEGVKFRVSSTVGGNERSSIVFIFDDDVEIDEEITIYRSKYSFDDAYRDGEGVKFVNSSEILEGTYYFVVEVFTEKGGKYIIPKKVVVENGVPIDIKISLDDSLKFSKLKYINVTKTPTIKQYIINSKFSIEGTVVNLVFEEMSISITYDEFAMYGLRTLVRNDSKEFEPIFNGDIITENHKNTKLYIENRQMAIRTFVSNMQVNDGIENYGRFGHFFTKDTSNDILISNEAEKSFDYFWNNVNDDLTSNGYGLVPSFATNTYLGDTTDINSIAYSLISTIVGIENGWVDPYLGFQRVVGTLSTIENLSSHNGAYYSKYYVETGEAVPNQNVNLTDTSQLLTAILIAGSYFGGDIENEAIEICKKVKWNFYFTGEDGKYFYNEYSVDNGYFNMIKKYEGQLLVYILAEGFSEGSIGFNSYYSMERHEGTYGGFDNFVHTWDGSLVGHLYAQSFVNFKDLIDQKGMDWYNNSKVATYSSKAFSDSKIEEYPSYAIGWGLSSSDMRDGYVSNHGSAPSGYTNSIHVYDGTVPVYSSLSSINFYPEAAIIALRNYGNMKFLKGNYGLYSAFDVTDNWTSASYNAPEKGLTLTMFANYKSDMIWKLSMENEYIITGLEKLGFQKYSYDTLSSTTVLTSLSDVYNSDTDESEIEPEALEVTEE